MFGPVLTQEFSEDLGARQLASQALDLNQLPILPVALGEGRQKQQRSRKAGAYRIHYRTHYSILSTIGSYRCWVANHLVRLPR